MSRLCPVLVSVWHIFSKSYQILRFNFLSEHDLKTSATNGLPRKEAVFRIILNGASSQIYIFCPDSKRKYIMHTNLEKL